MKKFTKHILLLALMLFGVAGAAWALPRAPQKFTGPVDIDNLVVGDTLAPGFELVCNGESQIKISQGNAKVDGNPYDESDLYLDCSLINNLTYGSNGAMLVGSDAVTPAYGDWQDGNAWVVTDAYFDEYQGRYKVTLGGISINLASDPYAPALDETTGNWNFLMPGSNKVVKAVLYDSIVLGPHVSVAVQPVQDFISYTRPGIGGDSTVLYYDPTLANSSFGFIANDDDGQGRNFAFWADDQNNHNTDRDFGGFSELTCGQRFVAVYPDNHTLTLVTPQGGGTLEIASVGVETVYNITFEQLGISGDIRSFTIPASRFPYDTTFSYNANIVNADAYDQMHESVSIIPQSSNTVTVRISGPFQYGGYYSCELEGGASDDWSISCTATGTQPKMPYGIRKTDNGTYSVMEGLTVSVTATPDSAHYLSAIDGHDTVSNHACGYSFVMPSDDKDLLAVFNDKPTLTLAQTAGGTLEAIVPQGGVTAMHLTTDQIPTWDGVFEPALETDLQQFGFVAVDSAAAAAWTGVPASGDIILVYALEGNQFKAILFQDGQWHGTYTSNFYKTEIYAYTNADVFYFTTGASKSNVIASSTPNTYYIDYGTPVTVVATPDAEHYLVSFSDDAPATERNSNIAVEKRYDSVIAPIDLSATFQAKPVLTLTANEGGTLTLDGMGGTTLTLISYSNIDLPDYQTVSREEARALCGTDITSGTAYVFYKNEGTAYIGILFQNGVEQELDIAVSNISYYVPDPYDEGLKLYYTTRHSLDGVTATETENQYRVDYGTEVTVVATPDSIHYLATLGEELVNSNDSIHRTFTMTANVNLPADFRAKPTLTLAHNDGGTLEAIVPQGGVTAIVPPTDQISGWENDNTGYLTESDMPAELGFVAVDQAAAEAWTGAPATGDALLIYGINGENFYYLSFNDGSLTGNDDGFLTPGSFYQMASAGTLYFTTGVTPNNVTASTEPNTYYIDYGTSVTVKATPSDTTYLVRFDNDADTNSNVAVEKTYGPLTGNVTSTATFHAKPTLTLAQTLGGTIELGGYSPASLSTAQLSVPGNWNENFNYVSLTDMPTDFQVVDENVARAWQNTTGKFARLIFAEDDGKVKCLNFSADGTCNETSYKPNGYDIYSFVGHGGLALYTTGAIPGGMPAGVASANATRDTFVVDYGTPVTVKATPEVHYHLEGWSSNVTDNGDSTATLTLTQDETVSATFAQNAPELAWMYDQEAMPAEGVSAYDGFVVDTIMKISMSCSDEFIAAVQHDNATVRYGSVNGVVTFANPLRLTSAQINGIGLDTIYAVHDGSVMAYDSVWFPVNIMAPDTLTLIHNDGGEMTVETLTDSIRAIVTDTTYAVVPGANVTVVAMPDSAHYLVNWDNDAAIYSNTDTTKHYVVNGNVTSTATFHAKPTLTLAQGRALVSDDPDAWGKVEIPIGLVATDPTPAPTPTAVANPVITGVLMPDGSMQVTMSCTTQNADIYYTTDNVTSPTCDCPAAPEYHNALTFTEPVTIKAAAYTGNDWSAVVTKTITLSLPDGVAQLDSVTYRVDYGTEVTVNAEATALHHVAGWQDEADNAYPAAAITYDNYAITEPANLFPALSTLTLTVTADTTTEVLFGINSYDVAATAQLDSRAEIGTGLAMGRIAAVYADIDGNTQFAGPDDTLTFTAQGGSSSSLIADTNYGYLFAGWYDANADTLMSDLPALILTEAYEVEARFVPDTFTVSYTQNIATAGTIEGADRYPYLTNMTLVATPATGYHFVNWKNEEGDILGTAAELPIQVLRDSAITAILDTNVYDVVANVNIEGLGTVTGAGEVKHFLSTTLVATANVKYHFVKWINAAGDSVSANTTIEVFPVGDTTLTAVFDTNIYATVWSGESDTTYTSLPYTGLTATYTDFWGNEHTPVLTFVCGSQTVVTPNYPVTAGTWTVTATPEVGDSLTSPVTTLTINRAIVNITGTTVETAKFYDENTDAVVTNAGTLNNVQGSDAVTHTTTASYSDATVGDGKTITVNYTLHGTSALLANYTLTPASEVYTTNGDIIEPMEPRPDEEFEESDTTEVDNGFEVYAYGYCTGTSYRINYQLRYGYPDQYKLDFTDSRFTDVDWTNLPTAGRNGHIDIDMPVDLPTGDYTVTVTFRDSRYTWLESTPLTVTFHVNLPETYTRPLFKNVIALVDTCHCFTDIQWYYRADATQEWAAIPGATGYYYHANADQLDGQFFVKAKMNGVETFTCPQTDVETLITDEDGNISMDVFPNPTTDRVTVTVNGSQQTTHTLRILNTLGVELESGTFEGDITTIDFSRYQRGSYMVSVDGTVVRVIRN